MSKIFRGMLQLWKQVNTLKHLQSKEFTMKRKNTFKIVLSLVAVIGAFTLAEGRSKLNVTATTTDIASLAEFIGGDRVHVTSLSRALQDAHYLNATPGMVARISRSDLLIVNGLDLEIGWMPEIIRQTRNRAVRPGGPGYVDASQGIKPIQIPARIHRDQGDVHPGGNPHYTLEPVRAQQAARNIAAGLERIDPQGKALYRQNLERYIHESSAALAKWKERFAPWKGAGVIIYHKHFDYMLEELGLKVVGAIEPLPGLAPSAGHIADLLSKHSKDTVKLVLMEPWHDQRVGRQVAKGIGVDLVVGCPAVGACGGAKDVISLFETNAAILLKALEAGGR